MSISNNDLFRFGSFVLDKAERLLLRDGAPIQLTLKAFDTLVVLLEKSGHVVNKEELMRKVWPDTFIGENTLASNISSLRKALGAEGQLIETVPKIGYRFAGPVTRIAPHSDEPTNAPPQPSGGASAQLQNPGWAGEAPDPDETSASLSTEESTGPAIPAAAGSAASTSPMIAPHPRRTLALKAAALAGIALLAAASVYVFGFRGAKGQPEPPNPRPGISPRSLAVLPFNQLNPDSGQEFLGLGMADTLITRLSGTRQVAVRPTSSINKYSGTADRDPVKLGQELGVDSVLDGTIQRSGDRVRVTVRLWSTEERRPVWAGEFDEKFTEMFSVEDSISEKVATALALTLSVDARKLLLKHYTDNAGAYQAYIKGRYHWSRWTPDEVRKAIACFEDAIKVDPGYSLAYAGLADSYNVLGTFGYVSPKEAWPATEAAAMKALELDEGLAEAHISLGGARMVYDWDWAAAELHFKRGIELAPDSANAHQVYGLYLMAMDRRDDALREMKLALQFDPLSPLMTTSMGWALLFGREYDAAIVELRKALDLDPNYELAQGSLELALVAAGKLQQVISLSDARRAAARARGQRWASVNAAYAYGQLGKRAEAVQIVEELKRLSADRYISPFAIATAYIGLGDKDEAFKWLEKAYEERSNFLWLLRVYPCLDGLRTDQRFQDLLRRVGLRG